MSPDLDARWAYVYPDTGLLGEPIPAGRDYASDEFFAGDWDRRRNRDDRLYGSGCSPSSATSLPDGVWFGYIESWGAESIEFDLACMDFDYKATNSNPNLRTLSVSDEAVYTFEKGDLSDGGPLSPYPYGYSFANVVEARATIGLPQTSDAVWLGINDGVVTEVEAWVGDTDQEMLSAGLPWVPWGPETGFETSHPFAAESYSSGMFDSDEGVWEYGIPDRSGDWFGPLQPGCHEEAPESLPDGVYAGHVWRSNGTDLAFHPEWANSVDASWPAEPICYSETGSWIIPVAEDAQYLSQQSVIGPLSARMVLGLPESIRPRWGNGDLYVYVNDGEVTQMHAHWQF
ncbi:MAG: hypothetical protein JW722_00295 [Demequinaceae bacterium]|nr:hypothetical protein [Demequinaceae bacterium]